MLGGSQANEGRQLARVVEACQVAELGDDRERNDPVLAAL
jgi:hypothetical protein